jgi:hypothetical protein
VIFSVAIYSRFYSQPVGWSSPKLTRVQVLFVFVFSAPLVLILLVVWVVISRRFVACSIFCITRREKYDYVRWTDRASVKEHGLFEDVLLEFWYDSILHLVRNIINGTVSNEWVVGQKLGTVIWLRKDKGVVYFELRLILQVKGTTEIVWYRNYLRGRLSWVRMPTGTRDFLLQNHPVLLRDPPRFLFNGNQASFLVLKGPGREADHSSTAAVKNGWNCTSFLPIYLNVLDTDSCSFTFTFKGRVNHTPVNSARGNGL